MINLDHLTRKVLAHRLTRPWVRRFYACNDLDEAKQICRVVVWTRHEEASSRPSPVAYLAGYARSELLRELLSRHKLRHNTTRRQFVAGTQYPDETRPENLAAIDSPLPPFDRDPFDSLSPPTREAARRHFYRARGRRRSLPPTLLANIRRELSC